MCIMFFRSAFVIQLLLAACARAAVKPKHDNFTCQSKKKMKKINKKNSARSQGKGD